MERIGRKVLVLILPIVIFCVVSLFLINYAPTQPKFSSEIFDNLGSVDAQFQDFKVSKNSIFVRYSRLRSKNPMRASSDYD